jgi:hypothetical protein
MNYLSKENVQEVLNLSPVQKNIIDEKKEHLVQAVYKLDNDLDINKINSSWNEIKTSLDVLRTIFRKFKGEFVQVVLKEVPGEIKILALSEIGNSSSDLYHKEYESERKEIDISTKSLIKISMINTSSILVTFSTLLFDYEGIDNLITLLLNIYQGKQPAIGMKKDGYKIYLNNKIELSSEQGIKVWDKYISLNEDGLGFISNKEKINESNLFKEKYLLDKEFGLSTLN